MIIDSETVTIEPITIPQNDSLLATWTEETKKCASTTLKVFKSQALWSFGAIGVTCALVPYPCSAALLLCIGKLLYSYPNKLPKGLLYELAVIYNLGKEKLTKKGWMNAPYFTVLQENIHLGALPLKSHGHHDAIVSLNVKSVISLVEEFEMQTETFFSNPVTKADWEKLKIEHVLFSIEDMKTGSLEELHKIADFIHSHKENGIYIHCKAGMGRSVMGYLAYKIKHEKMSFDAAHLYTKEKRPSLHLQKEQIEVLRAFEKQLAQVV